MHERIDLVESLRAAILSSDRTISAIARDAGVAPGIVSRFLSAGSDLRLRTAAKLACALGMELVKRK